MPGLFRLYNQKFGAFLAVTPFTISLILNEVTEEYWQEWFLNGNGRITNAGALYQLDITASVFEPGTVVGLYQDTGNPNQEWEILEVARDKSLE
ncbi:hypothetical protein Zmor_001561 [Zophobas morio]|uniref:Ricin B lectin domain-containing protein n=2 Tax=Zophobas morio TaxID=2755281 RepID=A0AA38J2U4_9CUCU|nr:hypothetical protein Zmor_001561 [Zophobas morio]